MGKKATAKEVWRSEKISEGMVVKLYENGIGRQTDGPEKGKFVKSGVQSP